MAKHSITAIFDTRSHAEQAVADLESAGVPSADIRLLPANGDTTSLTEVSEGRPKGFWASLEELFGGTEDHATYVESLRRGGIMVSVLTEDDDIDRVVDILERHGSVDLDERETTWRSEGWTGGTTTTDYTDRTTTSRSDLGIDSAGMAAAGAGAAAGLVSTGTTAYTERRETAVPVMDKTTTTTTTTTGSTGVVGALRAAADDVLQVVEERLDIGKRAVSRGKVRVRSSVITRDVSENVTLHGETVTVDRRPVDRPISAAALDVDPFKERVIEMEEYDEQAVVAKTAHVIEEIGIRKEGVDRVETVKDTLRSTKVDVEDGRTLGTASTLVGGFANEIRDDMEVVGSDGTHVGTVDHLDGTRIKLKKIDVAAGGEHHYLPTDLVSSVADKVILAVTAAEAKTRWTPAG